MSATQQTWWLFGGVFAILIFASTVGWLLQLRAAPGHAGIANLNARIKAWWVIVGRGRLNRCGGAKISGL